MSSKHWTKCDRCGKETLAEYGDDGRKDGWTWIDNGEQIYYDLCKECGEVYTQMVTAWVRENRNEQQTEGE